MIETWPFWVRFDLYTALMLGVGAVEISAATLWFSVGERGRASIVLTLAVVIGFCIVRQTNLAYDAGKIDGLRMMLEHRAAAAAAGCANAPKVVPYHQGMTLCPGQTAILDVPIPAPHEPAETPAATTKRGL